MINKPDSEDSSTNVTVCSGLKCRGLVTVLNSNRNEVKCVANLERAAGMHDVTLLIQSLKEGGVLENLQRCFSKMTNVFLYCVDKDGFPLTDFCGKEEETARIKELIDREQLQNMLTRLAESTLEDQAIETTAYPNLRLGTATVRTEGKPIISWVACGVIFDEEDTEDYENAPLEGFTSLISERQLARTIDALRDMTDALIKERLSVVSAQAADRRSRYLEKEMEEKLIRVQMLNRLIQIILEGGELKENTLYKCLKTIGEFSELSIAAIYRAPKNNKRIEMISKWCAKTVTWEIEETEDSVFAPFFRAEKTLVLSCKSATGAKDRETMQALGLKAFILIPIETGVLEKTYVCFGVKEKDRVWELAEIRFLSDAAKILQYSMAGQNRSDLLGARWKNILEHIGAAVCVRSLKTGDIIYTNSEMNSLFEKEPDAGDLNSLLGLAVQAKGNREFYYAKQKRWFDLHYEEIEWVDGNPASLSILRDCTGRKRSAKKKTT